MTITDKEDTTICNNFDDATQIVDHSSTSLKEEEKNDNDDTITTSEDNITKHKTVKTVGGIALGGVLLGTAASVFMDMKGAPTAELPDDVEELEENDTVSEGIVLPEIIVEALELLPKSPVNERMTFEEAFSAARDAMGPGYAFEWHGNVYATYTQEEWAELSDDQKSDFYDTLHIENPFASSEEVEVVQVDMSSQVAETAYAEASGPKAEEVVTAQTVVQSDEDTYGEDIPIVSVGNASDSENDIQILGVTQDISTGYNVGHLSVDGEEVVVIDVDGDMVFDSMVADLNHDGDITPDEIIDISQQSLSLNDLQDHSDLFNSLTSGGDTPDYLSEIVE